MKNKVSGLLMEAGVPYNQQKVHQKKYFAELLQTQKKEMPPSMPELLRLSRSTVEALTGIQRQLIRALESDSLLGCARGAAGKHSRSGPRGGPDLGAGDGRHQSLRFGEESRELFAGCAEPRRVRAARQSGRRSQNKETSICKPC